MWLSRMCLLALLYALYNTLLAVLGVALRGADAAGVDATVRVIGAVVVLMLVLVLDAPRVRWAGTLRGVLLDHVQMAAMALATGVSTVTEQHFIEPVGVIVALVALVGLQPAEPMDVAAACATYSAWFLYLLVYMRVYPRLLAAGLYATAFVGVCAALHLLWSRRTRAAAVELRAQIVGAQNDIERWSRARMALHCALRPAPLSDTLRTSFVTIVGAVRAHQPINARLAHQLVINTPWVRLLAFDDQLVVFYADSDVAAIYAARQLQLLTDGAVRLVRTTLTLSFNSMPFALGVRWAASDDMLQALSTQPPSVQHDSSIEGRVPSGLVRRAFAEPHALAGAPDLGALTAPAESWPLEGAAHRVAVDNGRVRYLRVGDVPNGWAAFEAARTAREADEALRWALVGAALLALSAAFDLALAPTRLHLVLWFAVAPALAALIGGAAWLAPQARPRLRPLWLLAVYALAAASSFGMPYRTTRLVVAQSYAALYIGLRLRTALAIHGTILVCACVLGAIDASAFASAYTVVYTLVIAAIGVATAVVEQRIAEALFCYEHQLNELAPQMASGQHAELDILERHVGPLHARALGEPVHIDDAVVLALIDVAEESIVAVDAILGEAQLYTRIVYRPVSGILLYQRSTRRPITGSAHADHLAGYTRALAEHCGGVGVGTSTLDVALVGSSSTCLLPIVGGTAVHEAIAAAVAAAQSDM